MPHEIFLIENVHFHMNLCQWQRQACGLGKGILHVQKQDKWIQTQLHGPTLYRPGILTPQRATEKDK